MNEPVVMVVAGLALVVAAVALIAGTGPAYGAWRLARTAGKMAPYLLGPKYGESLRFFTEVVALRESGALTAAAAMAESRVADAQATSWTRNIAVDVLISAGAYGAALRADLPPRMPTNALDAQNLVLIQINLAEAEYNLGRWEAAESRLRGLELAAWLFPITRAGLLLQRAWIAAHNGRPAEAIDLCDTVKPDWLPPNYRAEYYFARAAALLAADRLADAAANVHRGRRAAIRLSSKRNALFIHARLAAAQGDWFTCQRYGRDAAEHPFRGQGGTGLLLWAQALNELKRHDEADEALRLVAQRDPESEAARTAARLLESSPPLKSPDGAA